MKKLLFSMVALLFFSTGMFALIPTHEQYIKPTSDANAWLNSYYAAWTPGQPCPGANNADDENFFISRVKFKPRFTNLQTQVDPSLNPARKLLWWCPIGHPGWTSLPNYEFGSDAFSSWSYVDIYGNWTEAILRQPGAFADVCHKNGVASACVSAAPWAVGLYSSDGKWGSDYYQMAQGGADKLMKLYKYYGIDGMGFNSEQGWGDVRTSMRTLMNNCNTAAKKTLYGIPQLHFDFYQLSDVLNTSGGGTDFSDFFPAANGFFLNYNWHGAKLQTSVNSAATLGGSSWDVYAGMDMEGRQTAGWSTLANYNISIGIWGGHSVNPCFIGASEDGTNPHIMNQTYLRRQEYVFTGGTRNPVNTPAITDMLTNGSKAAGPLFHGVSKLMPAKSSLQTVPFVTYFNLGNGANLKREGVVTFANGWYNIGMQDYLPTWRWWLTNTFMGRDASVVAPASFVVGITHKDAWSGGSSLSVRGATTASYVQLFKTKFAMGSTPHTLTIRYKVVSGTAGSMSWACSTEDAPAVEKNRSIVTGLSAANQWKIVTTPIGSAGPVWQALANKVIAVMGLKFENTSSDFEVLIGEISLTKTAESITPSVPVVDTAKTKILKAYYNGMDFKIIFNSPTPVGHASLSGKPWEPVYNEEVNTWFFNIWMQVEGQDALLCTQTTSWAAYVVGAPGDFVGGNKRVRFGVSAVSTDGKNETAIQWTTYQTVTNLTVLNDVIIDKPVIKANEPFTIKFKDPTHAAANWLIHRSRDSYQVRSQNGVTQVFFPAGLTEEGSYDVTVGGVFTPGLIQISPASTGAMPQINSVTGTPVRIKDNNLQTSTVNYTSRNADGSVSKGLKIGDPYGFVARINDVEGDFTNTEIAKRAPYTYAMWFKATDVLLDRDGMNLLYKTDFTCDWPQNNWGEFWTQISPPNIDKMSNNSYATSGQKTIQNELMLNFCGWNAHNSPFVGQTAAGYPLTPGTWYHFAFTIAAKTTSNLVTIYINGKQVAQKANPYVFDNGCQSASSTNSGPFNRKFTRLYVGASGVYKSGFNGVIDELQCWDKVLTQTELLQAMKGYSKGSVPANLKGYWTFEETTQRAVNGETRTVFPNWGTGGEFCFGYYSSTPTINSDGNTTLTSLDEKFFDDNPSAGCPLLPGSYVVETTPTWSIVGGANGVLTNQTHTSTSGSVSVSNATGGVAEVPFKVYLTLENSWGTSTTEFADLVVYDHTVGLDKTEITDNMQVYPNPFVERVSMKFPQAGYFIFEVVNMKGQVISTNSRKTTEGEVVHMNIEGEKGLYLIRVKNEKNVVLQTVKITKK